MTADEALRYVANAPSHTEREGVLAAEVLRLQAEIAEHEAAHDDHVQQIGSLHSEIERLRKIERAHETQTEQAVSQTQLEFADTDQPTRASER
jgi:uncharacterized small protein (DUF1192 family)